MSPTLVTIGLIATTVLAAWLRFDAGSLIASWAVVAVGLGSAVASWIVRARRLPPVGLPRNVEELGAREELSPREEAEFAEGFRGWHRHQQLDAWRDIERRGPGPLILARAVLYVLWSGLLAVVIVPRQAIPASFLPGVPRFVVVLLPLLLAAVVAAVPLGLRDWKRATRAVADEERPPGPA